MANDYGYDVQKLYLEILLADSESFVRCQGIFDHTLFDRKLQEAAEFIIEYSKAYSSLPDYAIVNATCNTSLIKPESINHGNTSWLLDEFEKFTRHLSLKRAISKSIDLLENNEYGEMEMLIKEAAQIGLARDMGTNYFSDPRTRLLKIKECNGQLPTLWVDLDKLLYGGFNRNELEIFAAQSGGGKSLFLANLCINYASAKYTVVYITLELSEDLVCLRLDAMTTGVSTKEVFKNIDDTELKVKMLGKQYGGIQVKYLPSGKTVNDIRSYLKEFEVTFNKRVDVLAVDYLDLLMPISKKISAENLFIKDKYVSEELRNLAHEKNCLIISAAQFNRCLTLDTLVITKQSGEIEIKNIRVGDEILSDIGYNVVKEVYPVTKQKVYLIKTASGKMIKASSKHIFPTATGEKNIETGLSVGDKLIVKN